MRWNSILELVLDHLAADEDVIEVLGPEPMIRMASEHEFESPLLEWTLISDLEDECYEETIIQFDYWTTSVDDLVKLTRAIRRLLHHDVEVTIGGAKMWSMMVGGRTLSGTRDGQWNHSLDFRFQYLREKWVA